MKKRDSSLDLIRFVAFLSVISVHFFMNNGFYEVPVTGKRMYVGIVMRTFLMDCVPLFILLSGWLMNRKKLSGRYYLGVLQTLVTYVMAGVCCLLYRAIQEPVSLKEGIGELLSFSAAPYAWYIEMYVGLFLLIPFLNLSYHGLTSKRQKQGLVLTLLLMVALPPIFNIRMQLLPKWWYGLYPICYYFIGVYLSEYTPKIKTRWLLLLLAVNVLAGGSFNFYKSYGQPMVRGQWTDWGSLVNVVTSTLVFLVIKNIRTENWNLRWKAVVKYVSGLSLAAYLVSWIFDTIFYEPLLTKIPETVFRLGYMPVMVFVVAVGSLLLSVVVTFVSEKIAGELKHLLLHLFDRKSAA